MRLPDRTKLHQIAVQCPEYEPITMVQGYGISFLTNVEATVYPKCDWCLNWYGGTCEIYVDIMPSNYTPPIKPETGNTTTPKTGLSADD